MLTWRVLGTLACAVLGAHAGRALADWNANVSQRAAGSHVVLDLPLGYVPSKLYIGFSNDRLESTIQIAEQPGKSLAQIAPTMTADGLAKAGFTNVRPLALDRRGSYLALEAMRGTGEEIYTSFILALERAGGVSIITINVPARFLTSGKVLRSDIDAILATARHQESAE